MTIIAEAILDQARDYHESFDPERIQDKMLLRKLSQAERMIVQRAIELGDEFQTTPEVIDLATIQLALANDAGIALPEHYLVASGVVRVADSDRKVPLHILSTVHQHDPPYSWRPAAWIENRDLFLVDLRRFGGTTSGWDDFDEITLQIVLKPPEITDVGQAITLPDFTENALIEALAAFMAARLSVTIAVSQQEAERGLDRAAVTIARQSQVGNWYVTRR